MAGPEAAEYVMGRPHPALAGHVLSYGGYREVSAVPLRRRQAPTGSCTLILSFGPQLRLVGPAGPTMPASFLAGLHDGSVITEFRGEQHGVQVDLSPLGVFALLGRPMPELTNAVPRVDELGVPELASLPSRLAEDPGWPERFARLDSVLRRQLDASRVRPDPEVAWAWERLTRTGGMIGVQQLAEGTGWSRRHLLTRFRMQVGLTPKPTARVLRFQRASQLMVPTLAGGGPGGTSAGGGPGGTVPGSLADIAATCGYSDHAHLVREFHSLAGCTPTQYLAEWS